jgi:hypothetical protein
LERKKKEEKEKRGKKGRKRGIKGKIGKKIGIKWGSTNLPYRICRHVYDYLCTSIHMSSSNALLAITIKPKIK